DALASLKQHSRAVALYKKVTAAGRNEFYWDARMGIAEELAALGKTGEANRIYKDIRDKSGRTDLKKRIAAILNRQIQSDDRGKVSRTSDLQQLKELLPELQDDEALARAHYKIAQLLDKEDEEVAALKHYKKVTEYSVKKIAALSQLQLLEYYFTKKQYLLAYNEGQSLRYMYNQDYPEIVHGEKVLYMIGIAAYQTGNINDARELFTKLKQNYPSSSYLKKIPE
ncbi:MAG TPA: tetratricopeptide repeat protein, partial [Spirochaetota bacterium]|nr:tetratricopeptide repeat protein [Spirochaetota bacterium]